MEASRRFYCDLLGFRSADRIVCEVYGYHVDITFLHANPRHHSFAIGDAAATSGSTTSCSRCESMDDVGLAFDRALRAGVRIIQTLGRHPNDRMFSFYAQDPSGFQFEFGWGARQVDDATWVPTTYDRISEWGHHPPEFLAAAADAASDHEATTERRRRMSGRGRCRRAKYADVGDGLRVHYHEAGTGARSCCSSTAAGPGASGWSNFRRNYPYFAERRLPRASCPTRSDSATRASRTTRTTLSTSSRARSSASSRAVGVERCAVVGNSHGGAMSIQPRAPTTPSS